MVTLSYQRTREYIKSKVHNINKQAWIMTYEASLYSTVTRNV